uniref:Uncharacterized protein n=1 Tax=Anguilla anguilla TaxID=7936 RepID=A0A0E9SH52_ANGAN
MALRISGQTQQLVYIYRLNIFVGY